MYSHCYPSIKHSYSNDLPTRPPRPSPAPSPGALVTSLVQTLRPQEVEVVSPVATVTCEADCSSAVERFVFAANLGWDLMVFFVGFMMVHGILLYFLA